MLAVAFPTLAQQESIVLDPVTGDYIITYQGLDLEGNSKWQRVVYEPATKLDPTIKSIFSLNAGGLISYQYKIKNGRNSKQSLKSIRLLATSAIPMSQVTPHGWEGIIIPNDLLPDFRDAWFRIGWSYFGQDRTDGLAPGHNQQGFKFESNDLPGVAVAKLEGSVGMNGFPDEGPGDDNPIRPEYKKLMRNDFVPRFVAIPIIPVPTPFNAAIVLSGIQKHIKDDLIGMKLIDPVLASQLDRLLQAALDAAKINNTTAVRSNLKEARKLLKKEHADADSEDDMDFDKDDANETRKSALIDKLAARVLDFDLKYVEKRLKVE
jgi:hypothetical protein